MDLSQTVARVAAQFNLTAFRRVDIVEGGMDANMRSSSIAMAVARDPAHLGAIAADPSWKRIVPDTSGAAWSAAWSDDYSTILEPMLAKRK
jgi:hypothetical protein